MLKKYSGFILYILITVLVLSLYLDHHNNFEKVELAIQDYMFRLRGQGPTPQDIVIVAVDDPSLNKFGIWPWKNDKIAGLIDAIAAQNPKTILLDLPLPSSKIESDSTEIDSLPHALAAAGNVVLGYDYSKNATPGAGRFLPAGFAENVISSIDDPSLFAKYPPEAASMINIPEAGIVDSAAGLGFNNHDPDPDQIIRWQPLIIGYRGEFFPSAQVEAVAHFYNLRQSELRIKVGKGLVLGQREIPTDSKGRIRINFNGPENTFKYYSASDIMNKRTAPNELSGRLVIVGYTAFGTPDLFSSPSSKRINGAEISANIIENIIHGNLLKGASGNININLAIILIIGLFGAFVLPKISLLLRVAALVIFMIVIVNLNYVLFSSFNIVTKTLYPVIEIVIFMIAAPIVRMDGRISFHKKADEEDDEEVDYETLLSSNNSAFEIEGDSRGQKSKNFKGNSGNTPGKRGQDRGQSTRPLSQRSSSVAVAPEEELDHFGRYQVIGPIGKGAMGMVYKGLDPAIDRLVALKTIRVDQIADSIDVGELKERLTREAKAAGKLSHPNIVTIYDAGEEGPIQYIAMEYLEGETLESIIRRRADWDYRTLSKIMIQVCDGLDYAHENGIVHRDIKPANIMVLEANKIKVMDFGIARVDKSASMTQTGTTLGTPNYISPEQLKGMPVDRRSDIFSLGVVFYELLTMERPFKGETISALIYSILHTNPPLPSEINLDIPRIFDKIVTKAIVKDPELRFQKARDIAEILRKLI